MLMKNEIILSTYFSSKPDIQRGQRQSIDDFDYFADWYTSIVRLGMYGVIFHDELTDHFVKKHTCDNIKFEKVALGELSTNDERFFIYEDYLKKNKYDNIFMTDISDVWFKKNPFELINDKYKLLVGSEPYINSDKKWMVKRYEIIYGKLPEELANEQVLNAGIIGGSYAEIMKFLSSINAEMKNLNKLKGKEVQAEENLSFNMAAFNKVLRSKYKKVEIYTGGKLHSPYKSYLKEGDYYIFHK